MSVARRLADMAADVLAFCLRLGGRMFYRYFVDALVARHPAFESPSQGVTVRLHAPDPVAPDPAEREWVERIFSAYRAAKDRDVEALVRLNDPLYQSCVTCHSHYRPGYGRR